MNGDVSRLVGIGLLLAGAFYLSSMTPPATMSEAVNQVVDAVRGVVGPEPIALAENAFYGAKDTVQQWTARGQTAGFWASLAPGGAGAAATLPDTVKGASRSAFAPRAIAPLFPKLAAAGEGQWTPIPNSFDAAAAPLMYKTFLHPDGARPYARLAVVALDLTRLRLHAVAGTQEPVSAARVPRTGLIPNSDLATLVAAFNGGFKAIHGNHGMMVDGQTLLPPMPEYDTIALYRDGSVRIAPWSVISNTLPLIQSYRQTPAYLALQGRINPALQNEQVQYWGKSVSGQTVIWRSALGLSADRQILYYGAGESLTALHLGEGMIAAGAADVAELDVNWSFERFLIYTPGAKTGTEKALLDQMVFQPGLYTALPSSRDYFYITLRK